MAGRTREAQISDIESAERLQHIGQWRRQVLEFGCCEGEGKGFDRAHSDSTFEAGAKGCKVLATEFWVDSDTPLNL